MMWSRNIRHLLLAARHGLSVVSGTLEPGLVKHDLAAVAIDADIDMTVFEPFTDFAAFPDLLKYHGRRHPARNLP